MKKSYILETAHLLLSSLISKKDVVVDATMGNGHDTVYLAGLAQHVYAFDIQEKALYETQKKVNEQELKNVSLILDSHQYILNHVNEFKGVIFNLGYLPNGNKEITTKSDVTLETLHLLIPHMKISDFIMLVIYIGHPQGFIESKAIEAYLKTLDNSTYKILRVDMPYQNNQPPYINLITKIKDGS
jgi:methylase of polypeptide subunit release factors